jgi:hypothetical protein
MSPDFTDPQHRRPLWVAALVTCLTIPTLFFLIAGYFDREPAEPVRKNFAEQGPLALFAALPLSAIAMYALAMPLIVRSRNQGVLSLLRVCAICVGAGVVVMILFCLLLQVLPSLVLLAFAAGVGLFAGLLFAWTAGVRLRIAGA